MSFVNRTKWMRKMRRIQIYTDQKRRFKNIIKTVKEGEKKLDGISNIIPIIDQEVNISEVPSNLKDSIYVPEKIRNSIENISCIYSEMFCIHHNLSITLHWINCGTRGVSKKPKGISTLRKMLRNAYVLTEDLLERKDGSLTFYICPTKEKKNTNDIKINGFPIKSTSINNAISIPSMGIALIYRREECFKVITHEFLHCMGLTENYISSLTVDNNIVDTLIETLNYDKEQLIHVTETKNDGQFRPNEALVEYYANLAANITRANRCGNKYPYKELKKRIINEIRWGIFCLAKISNIAVGCNVHITQETHFLSYYGLRSILMFSVERYNDVGRVPLEEIVTIEKLRRFINSLCKTLVKIQGQQVFNDIQMLQSLKMSINES